MDYTPMHLRRFLGEAREDLSVYGINRSIRHSEQDPAWRKFKTEEIRQKRRLDGFSHFEESPEGRKLLDAFSNGLITQNEFDAAKKKWEEDASWREDEKLRGVDPGTKSEIAKDGDEYLDAKDAEMEHNTQIDRERRAEDMEAWMRGEDLG